MGKLLNEFKAYLEAATPGQKYTDWKALQQYENVGPDAEEFVENQLKYNQIEQTRGPVVFDYIQHEGSNDMEIIVPDCKEIVLENGRYILRDRKPKYPKDYEECLEILERDNSCHNPMVASSSMDIPILSFAKLIVAREAYWKIAGEEMGLDKHWEPDWCNDDETKFCIYTTQNMISLDIFGVDNRILAFPTEEMREAFYENFKGLIEQCKYFL